MASNEKYQWDEVKRQKILTERDLDIKVIGPEVLADPYVKIETDVRRDYGEVRYRAFGIARGFRLCLGFSIRGEYVRLITIFRVNDKDWGKHYGKDG
jgi:uncharacterized DUF497 family protein